MPGHARRGESGNSEWRASVHHPQDSPGNIKKYSRRAVASERARIGSDMLCGCEAVAPPSRFDYINAFRPVGRRTPWPPSAEERSRLPDDVVPADLRSASFSNAAQRARPARLRALLVAPELSFLMEAHSGLSAKIVEEAGSPACGRLACRSRRPSGCVTTTRRRGRRSWTCWSSWRMPRPCRSWSTATPATAISTMCAAWCASSGSAASPASASRTSCSRRPTPSWGNGSRSPTSPSSAAGSVPARMRRPIPPSRSWPGTEALISGHSMEEALRRAEAYHAAGADAILVHSKRKRCRRKSPASWRRGIAAARSSSCRRCTTRRPTERIPPGRHFHDHLGQSPGSRFHLGDARDREARSRRRSR